MAGSVETGSDVFRVGVLTISDRSSQGLRDDLSGPAIQRVADEHGFIVSISECIPDDGPTIQKTLIHWADKNLCDCILTTGGTGLSERDVTPDTTQNVLQRLLPHLAAHIALIAVS